MQRSPLQRRGRLQAALTTAAVSAVESPRSGPPGQEHRPAEAFCATSGNGGSGCGLTGSCQAAVSLPRCPQLMMGTLPTVAAVLFLLQAQSGRLDWAVLTIILLAQCAAALAYVLEWRRRQGVAAASANRRSLVCRVRRAGWWSSLPASALVPQDVIELAAGDIVLAECVVLGVGPEPVTAAGPDVVRVPVSVTPGTRLAQGTVMRSGSCTATVTASQTHTDGATEVPAGFKERRGTRAVVQAVNTLLSMLALFASAIFLLFSSRWSSDSAHPWEALTTALVVFIALLPLGLLTACAAVTSSTLYSMLERDIAALASHSAERTLDVMAEVDTVYLCPTVTANCLHTTVCACGAWGDCATASTPTSSPYASPKSSSVPSSASSSQTSPTFKLSSSLPHFSSSLPLYAALCFKHHAPPDTSLWAFFAALTPEQKAWYDACVTAPPCSPWMAEVSTPGLRGSQLRVWLGSLEGGLRLLPSQWLDTHSGAKEQIETFYRSVQGSGESMLAVVLCQVQAGADTDVPSLPASISIGLLRMTTAPSAALQEAKALASSHHILLRHDEDPGRAAPNACCVVLDQEERSEKARPSVLMAYKDAKAVLQARAHVALLREGPSPAILALLYARAARHRQLACCAYRIACSLQLLTVAACLLVTHTREEAGAEGFPATPLLSLALMAQGVGYAMAAVTPRGSTDKHGSDIPPHAAMCHSPLQMMVTAGTLGLTASVFTLLFACVVFFPPSSVSSWFLASPHCLSHSRVSLMWLHVSLCVSALSLCALSPPWRVRVRLHPAPASLFCLCLVCTATVACLPCRPPAPALVFVWLYDVVACCVLWGAKACVRRLWPRLIAPSHASPCDSPV